VKIRTHRATVALREAMERRLRGPPERAKRLAPDAPRPGNTSDGGVPT